MSTYLIKKGFTMPNYWVESTPNVWKNTPFGVEKGFSIMTTRRLKLPPSQNRSQPTIRST